MAIRQLSIAVTDFLHALYHPKDLGSGFVASTRGQEGTQGHQLVSSRQLPGYRAEVPIEFQYEQLGYQLILRGRIDGLLTTEAGLLVEEVKTTYLPLGDLQVDQFPIHLAQLQLYLYFVSQHHPGREVSGRLTYLNLDDLSERSFAVNVQPEQSEAFFRDLADGFLRQQLELEHWQQVRNDSILGLCFPFPTPRPGQTELIETVLAAVTGERDLIAEAATGIGKTVAVLFPALQSLARQELKRLFFLTAKTVGKEIVKKTLANLTQQGLRLRTVFIEAKDRVCPSPGSSCKPGGCPYTDNYYAKVDQLIPALLAYELITPEVVAEWGRHHQVCPYELSLDLALQADLIIGDYNYLFDPGVYLRRFFLGPKRRDCLFLIDEAHNLVARGREMYSATLEQSRLQSLEFSLRRSEPRIADAVVAVGAFFEQWERDLWKEQRPGVRLAELPEMFEPALEKLAALCERFLRQQTSHPLWETVNDFYLELTAFIRIAAKLDANYALYAKQEQHGVRLRLFCLNPGPRLRERLEYSRSAVFFSATLAPAPYFQQLLGAREPLQLRLTSPFPQENRLYLHVPGVDTRFNARKDTANAVAQAAADLVLAHNGNYLMFFPSYAYLQTVWPLIIAVVGARAEVFTQSPQMSNQAKMEFLRRVSNRNPNRSNLGLAVLGGIFGEGIDLPGEELVGVIIVGPGLPTLSDEQELLKLYYDEQDGRGMLYAYIIPGLIRVIQSAGRVFRTPEDRGVVLLLDDRFLQESYQDLLPPDWFLPGRPFSTPEYRQVLAEFWNQND